MSTSLRVIFTDSGPLPLSNVRAPLLPVPCTLAVLFQPLFLFAEKFLLVNKHHYEGPSVDGL